MANQIEQSASALEAMDSRSIENPAIPLTSSSVAEYIGLSAGESAGVAVNESTAMTTSSVWAAVQLLAGAVGMLPIGVYRRTDRGRESQPDHPIARLLDIEVNPDMTRQVMLEALMCNTLLYGRGMALIERGRDMRPKALYPLPSDKVKVERRGGLTSFTVYDERVGTIVLRPTDVLYIPGLTTDGLSGISPVRQVAGAVGVSIAAEREAGSFFKNGSRPGGLLKHPGTLSPESAKRLRVSWEGLHEGAQNAFKTAILEEGMEYAPVGVSPKDSQLLEARKFQVVEIARIFGVPPHMLQDLDRATFSNIEHMGIQFVTYALNRYLVRIESEIRRKLFLESEKPTFYVKINPNALMRGDAATRSEFYTKMVSIRAMSPNEVRALEEMNPYDGGDVYENPNTSAGNSGGQGDAADDAEPADDGTRARWAADIAGRMAKQERDRVMAAVRKYLFHGEGKRALVDEFRDWCDKFYDGFSVRMDEAYAPIDPSYDASEYVARQLFDIHTALQDAEPGDAVAKLFTEPTDEV